MSHETIEGWKRIADEASKLVGWPVTERVVKAWAVRTRAPVHRIGVKLIMVRRAELKAHLAGNPLTAPVATL